MIQYKILMLNIQIILCLKLIHALFYITSNIKIQNQIIKYNKMNSTGNSKAGGGNILKDSYYKQRLLKSSAASMNKSRQAAGKTYNQTNQIVDAQDSDDDEDFIPEQQKQLNMQKILHRFGKTSSGQTYAFLDFVCTHKKLKSLKTIKNYKHLEVVDISYNHLHSLKYLSGLKYLTSITAINNQLTSVLDMKFIPEYLDFIDLSYNLITKIPSLKGHKHLRVLKLVGNKIQNITGLQKNKKIDILNLSENQIQQIKGLDNLNLKQLYLGSNKIEVIKNLQKLVNLRILMMENNRISKLSGVLNLVALRELNLSKNSIKNIREIRYLQNLMYLTNLDLCYNPIQQRQYYRLQVIYKLPMLNKLDGVQLTGKELVNSQNFYGLDYEERQTIFIKKLPEEQFVDRRVFKSDIIPNETDSEGEVNKFVDEYDQQGKMTKSNRSKDSKGFNTSKRSVFSKASRTSKGRDHSK